MYSAVITEKREILRRSLFEGSLAPYFIPLEKYKKLANNCELFSSCLEKFLRLYTESKEIQDLFPELDNYRDLTLFRPISKYWIHHSRFDLIETESGNFKLLETNCASPAFLTSIDYQKMYQEKGLLSHFLNSSMQIVKQPMEDADYMAKSWVELSKEVLGNDSPNIAIFTTNNSDIKIGGQSYKSVTEGIGLRCAITSIQDVTMGDHGKIYAGEMPIDVAYQKLDRAVDTHGQATCFDYDSSEDKAQAYLIGLRERKFVLVNNFISCLVAENKKILALLKRPEFQQYFSAEEQDVIRELLPETYCFDKTNQNTFQELVEKFIQNKSDWVIKSTLDGRGRAVWLGISCTDTFWKNLVNKLPDGNLIIQKFISQVPTVLNQDQQKRKPMNLVISLHIVRGRASGIGVRASEDIVVNAQLGALWIPSYVVSQQNIVDEMDFIPNK